MSLFFTLLIQGLFAYEADAIVVTAERVESQYQNSTSSIRVYENEEFEKSGGSTVADFLRTDSSLEIRSAGSYGSASSLFFRGTENGHTIVEVDGVVFKDVTGISESARLDLIPLDQVERIEVMSGSQGVLYGSAAIGGVIKIVTKKKTGGLLSLEAGSYGHKKVSFHNRGQSGKLTYAVRGSTLSAEGFSSFNENRAEVTDKDGQRLVNLGIGLQRKLNSRSKLEWDISADSSKSEFDDSTADNSDNHDSLFTLRQHLGLDWREKKDHDFLFNLNHSKFSRRTLLKSSGSYTNLVYKGETLDAEAIHRMKKISGLQLVQGGQWFKRKGESLGSSLAQDLIDHRFALFSQAKAFLGQYTIAEAGARWEKLEGHRGVPLFRLAGVQNFPSAKWGLKASISNGTRFPSLYQVSWNRGAEIELKAEKSTSYEVGIWNRTNLLDVELSFYRIDYKDLIGYDISSDRYSNTSKGRVTGLEFSTKILASDALIVELRHTEMRAINPVDGSYLLKRSRRKSSAGLFYDSFGLGRGNLEWSYRGEVDDYAGERVPSFWLVNLGWTYPFKNRDKMWIKLNNILDKDYEETKNY